MRPRKVKGEWVYPHSADVLVAAHLQTIEYYIQKRRHTVYNTIRGRDVLKECEGAERRRGTPPRLFWAEQDMTGPEQREYLWGGRGGKHTHPDGILRARGPAGAAHYRRGAVARGHAGDGRGDGGQMQMVGGAH